VYLYVRKIAFIRSYSQFHRDAIFFARPRRYASGHVLFYDCARNERDAREKIENERVDGPRSDIENAKLAGGYKSLGRSCSVSFCSEATLSAFAA